MKHLYSAKMREIEIAVCQILLIKPIGGASKTRKCQSGKISSIVSNIVKLAVGLKYARITVRPTM